MSKRLAGIDVVKLLMAFVVVAIHTTSWNVAHLTDVAVPYFFIVSGFLLFGKFTGKKEEDLLTIKSWILRVFKLYFIWSLVYLPFAVYGFHMDGLSVKQSVMVYLRNFIFVGENYLSWPLWYLLGLIWCGVVIYLLKAANVPAWGMLLVGFALFVAAKAFSLDDLAVYTKVFKTTRNGLFLGLLYVTSGGVLAELYRKGVIGTKKENWIAYIFAAVIFFIALQFSDYFLWPFAVALFLFSLSWPLQFPGEKISWHCGKMSRDIYLVHMLFAGLLVIFLSGHLSEGLTFVIVSLLSTLVSLCSIYLKRT